MPQIQEAIDDVAPRTGVLQYGDYTNDTSPVVRVGLTSESAAGDQLQLADNGATLATVVLTAQDLSRGYVDFQVSGLSADWHLFSATDLSGGAVKATSSPWALGISTATPPAPVIQAVTDDVGPSTGALADGAHTDDAQPTFQIFEAGLPPPPTSSPGHAPYGGPALLGGTVQLYDGHTLVATGIISYGGTVTLTSSTLAPGDHVLTAVATDRAADSSAASAPFHLTIGADGAATSAQPSDVGASLSAHQGQTSIDGGAGDDTISGWSGGDYLRGGDGNDSIIGGSGFDDINGNKGQDTIDGGSGGNDWLVGGQGNDLITAHASNNILYGNLGDDTVQGGSGDDLIRGGQGDDVLIGGAGNDWISGDRGSDTLTGGAGADTFHTFSGAGLDVVTDFNASEGDRVQVDPGTSYTLSQSGADVHIDFGAGDEMVLQNVQLSSLPSDWIFAA